MDNIASVNSVLMGWAIVGFITCLVNLGIFALNLKLYTEYFKDKAQDKRSKPND